MTEPGRWHAGRRWRSSALTVAALVGFFVYPTYSNYDSLYSLLWGRSCSTARCRLSTRTARRPSTRCGSSICVPLAALGLAGDRILLAICVLSFVAMVAAMYRLGKASFGWVVGLVAALLVLSRLDFPFLAARGYIDIPYLALILWAAALEAEKPKRGGIVWVLLTLAGLLRPEAWLLAGIYGLWLVWGKPLREWVKVGAIMAFAPVVWALSDFIVTGDPMYSLNYTTESSRLLGRRQSLTELPGVTLRYLSELTKPPVFVAALAGIVLAWRMARARVLVPATLLIWGRGTFLLVSLRGFSVISRYVFVAALALMLFAAFAMAGFSRLPRGHRAIRPWAIGSGAIVVGGLVYTASIFNPAYVNRELKLRDSVRKDLTAVLESPRVKAAARVRPDLRPQPQAARRRALDRRRRATASSRARTRRRPSASGPAAWGSTSSAARASSSTRRTARSTRPRTRRASRCRRPALCA